MCDACTNVGLDGEPLSPERMAALEERTKERILKYGHEVVGVYSEEDDPEQRFFFYTQGRSVFDKPELLVTGRLRPEQGMSILNRIAALDNAGTIDLSDLADNGEPTEVEDFNCKLKFMWADPRDADMYGAIELSGVDVPAIQVIWPDPQGLFPDDPAYTFTDTQTLHPLGSYS